MPVIKVAVAGVGNCCSAFVQGVQLHKQKKPLRKLGLLHTKIGPYRPEDVEFVAAFDIDSRKVGRDLSDAIFQPPNNTLSLTHVPRLSVTVSKANPYDGVGALTKNEIQVAPEPYDDITAVLEESGADILVNLTPTGADHASEAFALAALQADCAFVNGTPARLASTKLWSSKFKRERLPLFGDDLVDQVGATMLHKSILQLLVDRGVKVDESYQLDIGGGTESLNALDKPRYEAKREIKNKAVGSVVPYKFPLVAGTSDYVDFMKNSRMSYFWIKGRYFAGAPFTIDLYLHIIDGPAGAGTLIDVVRLAKLAKDRKLGGALKSPSAFAFKIPPVQAKPHIAQQWLQEFIAGKRRD